jgi:hypothetical protein
MKCDIHAIKDFNAMYETIRQGLMSPFGTRRMLSPSGDHFSIIRTLQFYRATSHNLTIFMTLIVLTLDRMLRPRSVLRRGGREVRHH